MKNTTLCYIEKDGCYLLLHRIKKENDLNRDKWVGIGGKFEENESPEECLLREAREETGLTLTDYRTGFEGSLADCNEGVLEWIPKERFAALPQWEGDRLFLSLMERHVPFFSMKLRYEGDRLVEKALDGKAF